MTVCYEIFKWPEKANWAAINFMGGVGGYQMAPCGGLTGTVAALGMMFGKDADTREQAKEARMKARAASRQVFEEFQQEFGATVCLELSQRDFNEPGAFQRFANEGGFEQKCNRYVVWLMKKVLQIAQADGLEASLP